MEEKRKRLNQAVDWLLYKHMAGSISEIAEKTGVNRSHFSSVLKDKNKPVTNAMLLKLCAAYTKLDFEWLSEGKGNSLARQDMSISGKNIVNGNATNSIVGDFHDLSVQMPNKYGDSPSEERKWAPVVPTSMAKTPGFDILGHISKQIGGRIERLVCGAQLEQYAVGHGLALVLEHRAEVGPVYPRLLGYLAYRTRHVFVDQPVHRLVQPFPLFFHNRRILVNNSFNQQPVC